MLVFAASRGTFGKGFRGAGIVTWDNGKNAKGSVGGDGYLRYISINGILISRIVEARQVGRELRAGRHS